MFDRLFRRASASNAALSVNLPDDDTAERLQDAQQRIAQLELLLQSKVVELAEYRALATAKPAKVPATKKPAAVKVAKPVKMTALEFWAIHGQAVERIRAEFGDSWKVRAPFGKTELGTVASRLCSYTTERGTKLKWHRDNRVPAAEYWPGGVIPDVVTVQADYSRVIGTYIAVKDTDGCYSKLAISPPEIPHDADWHTSRGYTPNDDGGWEFELGWRANDVHQEAIAANAVAKAAAELAEVDGEMLAEAAD